MMVKATLCIFGFKDTKSSGLSFFYWVAASLMGCISHDVSCFKWLNPQVNQPQWTTANLLAHITHLLMGWKDICGPDLWTQIQGLRPLWLYILSLKSSYQLLSLRLVSSCGQKQTNKQAPHSPRFICLKLLELVTREREKALFS